MKDETYVTFIVAPYALAHLFRAFELSKIKHFFVTLEDDNLVVRIPNSHLDRIACPAAFKGELCSPPKGDE